MKVQRRRVAVGVGICPNAASHTVGPQGYVAWHEWVEQMARTHQQALCTGCGRWLIWTSRTPGGAT